MRKHNKTTDNNKWPHSNLVVNSVKFHFTSMTMSMDKETTDQQIRGSWVIVDEIRLVFEVGTTTSSRVVYCFAVTLGYY